MYTPADQNFVRAKMGVLNTDGVTLVTIKCIESTGAMKMNSTDTINFTMSPISLTDENFNKTMLFEGTDGLNYPWVVNSNGEVLVNQ